MNPALAAAAFLAQIQVRDEPKDWRLLETPHFNLYYPSEELLPRAREFAAWFEKARAELAAQTGHEPRRVNVFLYRSFHDLLQASYLGSPRDAAPLADRVRRPAALSDRPPPPPEARACRPHARSRALALAEPTRDRIFIHCQDSDRWNWWFIKHELAHQVQFEHLYAFRLPSWLIALKDPLIPAWFWEGGADFLAGIFDSHKDQFMRDLARERLYDLKELFFPDVLNPYDFLAIYYQGSYFWRFLDEAYGPGTARRVFERYDRGLPVASLRPLKAATGRDRETLERDFEEHLRRRWAPVEADRGEPSERLTDSRAYYRRRAWGGRWSPDGARLAWVGDENVWPELYVDGRGLLGRRRGIDLGFVVSPPAWSPDGRRLAVIEWTTNRDDLLLVNVDGGTESVRLPFDELYDPAWSPDGTRIVFSALRHGTSDLWAWHLADGRLERLTDDAAADRAPAWSRDGRLAWIKEVEGRTILYVDGRPVTRSWALLEYPQWSPDGKAIVLAADVDGVWDAFEVDPATGRARRLTRFRGGVSYPAYHPDGSLVVTYYEGRGQDLYRVRPEPQEEPRFDQEERRSWYDAFRKPPPQGEPAEKSRVWGVNWLMFPVTSPSLLTPGVEFSFGDRDAENTLSLSAAGTSSRLWTASATVANTRWRPTIGARAAGGRLGDLTEIRGEPFVDLPLWTTVTTGVGWVARYRDQEEEEIPDPHVFDSGPTASLFFSNRTGYRYWDSSWGFAFGGTASFFREDFGGDRDLNEYFGFVEGAYDFVQDWTLWCRATYEKLVGPAFLEAEILELGDVLRGAEDLEGLERGVVSLEFRFPLWRDLLWKPLELIGLGEWLILKDLRGFAFGQAGYAGTEFSQARDDDFGAASAGLGLRLDFSFMLWPLVNLRVPARVEVWGAIVGQDEDDPRGAVGGGFVVGF